MPVSRSDDALKERRQAIVETLRSVGWVGVNDGDPWMYETADVIEQGSPEDWDCCPLCEEVTCDDGCPVKPIRRAHGLDFA